MKVSDFIAEFLVQGSKSVLSYQVVWLPNIDSFKSKNGHQCYHASWTIGCFAAEGYARIEGSLAVLATSGPGAPNLQDRNWQLLFWFYPCCFITGQVNRVERRSGNTQLDFKKLI
jgi:hypothetical protein